MTLFSQGTREPFVTSKTKEQIAWDKVLVDTAGVMIVVMSNHTGTVFVERSAR